jgi:hypothetical protein
MVRTSTPARHKRFLLLQSVCTGSGFHPVFYSVLFPEREVDNSSLSSAEVKNDWSCTSTPAECFRGLDRDDHFVFTLV